MRLEKYLAESGLGTRSQCKEHIKRGRITVNGVTVTNGALQVVPGDLVLCGEKTLIPIRELYYMFHKPAGCICATRDPKQRTVLDYFPADLRNRLLIAGRLDKDTEGLLLLSDSGAFCHSLTSPKRHVAKTYYFTYEGVLCRDAARRVYAGMDIGDEKPTLPGELQLFPSRLQNGGTTSPGGAVFPAESPGGAGTLTIREGRYHQVKRMIAALGGRVTYLKRLSVGALVLDESLRPGEYRELTKEETALFI